MRITDPYAGADWSAGGIRGNLHCHSRQSDGAAEPQEVIAAYAALGHGFLMLSDHDRRTEAEQLRSYAAHGLILIPGSEVTAEGPHVLYVGGSGHVAPGADRQRVLDAISAQGGLAVMNHPNWFNEHDHWPQEALLTLGGYTGIEIFNALIGELPGSSYALDRWDRLLSRGRQVWGFANDDAHQLHHAGQGWNTVFPQGPGADGVVAALRTGRFYASSGVTIDRIAVDGERIVITSADTQRIVAIGPWGRRLAVADGSTLAFTMPPREAYVRFECWGHGERFAWTQPFFVEQ